jgi:drug/metabolite transporter (DMT)-like permease
VAPVTGTYPVIATLGAWALLRERPGWRVGVALILFVVGIGLLSAA